MLGNHVPSKVWRISTIIVVYVWWCWGHTYGVKIITLNMIFATHKRGHLSELWRSHHCYSSRMCDSTALKVDALRGRFGSRFVSKLSTFITRLCVLFVDSVGQMRTRDFPKICLVYSVRSYFSFSKDCPKDDHPHQNLVKKMINQHTSNRFF